MRTTSWTSSTVSGITTAEAAKSSQLSVLEGVAPLGQRFGVGDHAV